MVKYQEPALDAIFAALADPTRRQVLASLAVGGRPEKELAGPHAMSLPGFIKHLRVLEDAGLIACAKQGRVVHCTLAAEPLAQAAAWLARYRHFWSGRLDALGRFLYQQEELTPCKTVQSRPGRRSGSAATTTPRRKKSGAPGPTRKR